MKYQSIADQIRDRLHLPNAALALLVGCTPKAVQAARRSIEGRHQGGWSDARVEALKELWSEGWSASQIAARLGGVTRNAVIAKVHRLGVSGRAKGSRNRPAHMRTKVHKPTPKPISPARAVLKRDGLPIPTPAEFDVARISFNDLESHHCRFPCLESVTGVPQDQSMYCGLKPFPGLPYCEAHAVRAYQPPQPRRRQDIPRPAGTTAGETAEKELQVA